jgi:hypothetical protein
VSESSPVALLDTNVFLLWLVGLTDTSLLKTFKRVDTFDEEDFTTLGALLGRFQHLITTPHVLSEVSNFVDQAPQHRRLELVACLRKFIEDSREIYEAAKDLASGDAFSLLGLTDVGLWSLSLQAVVITTDYALWGRIHKRGGLTINFNHLRPKQPVLKPPTGPGA